MSSNTCYISSDKTEEKLIDPRDCIRADKYIHKSCLETLINTSHDKKQYNAKKYNIDASIEVFVEMISLCYVASCLYMLGLYD